VKVRHSLRLGSPWLAGADSPRFAEGDVLLRFPFSATRFASPLAIPLFASLLDAGVPALGFPAEGDPPRFSAAAETGARAPAVTGEKWLRCIADCKCAVCCSNDSGRDVLCLP